MTATLIVKTLLIAYFSINALATVALVGVKKEGRQYTNADALASILVNSAIIYMIWWL